MQATWLIRRLAGILFVLLIVVVGTFFLLQAAPGDALDAWLAGNGGADADRISELRAAWGLDQAPWQRLLAYLWALVHGDFGWSVTFERPVLSVLLERLPTTLILMGLAIGLSLALGLLLGLAAGARPGSAVDRILSMGSLALYAVPSFWLALVLIAIFAVNRHWLPTSGWETIASGKTGLARVADIGRHLVLPVASLGLVYMALYLRLLRDGMAATWQQDFVRAARARGIAGRRLVLAHVARNALLPVATMLGLQSASLLGGSIVIESVFAIPGFGRLAFEAVTRRDMPLLLGVVLFSAVVVVLVNLLIDLGYGRLDPRVRIGGQAT